MKFTKQGVRDLGGNGRQTYPRPRCRHNYYETVIVGFGYEADEGVIGFHEVPVYGVRCGWCGETRRA